jgi:transcriptional regulator with XRE-family HTH domain
MPSSTPEVVAEVDVGERLRDIRQLRRATLRTIADRAGVSESFLSQVERGRASASIASLRRIAGALGVTVADLFEPSGPPQPRVLRRNERPSLSFGILGRKHLLTPRPLQHLEVFVGELDPGGSTGAEPYAHGDSEELFVVIAGSVQLELGGSTYELESGDSIDYRSSTPHRVSNAGEERAEVMWIISPPSY